MNRKTMTAVLTAVLLFAGAGTASADGISLCEHWYGDPTWTCGLAFGYSEAGGGSCKMQFAGGFPQWLDKDITSIDPDDLNDEQRDRIERWKEQLGHHCKCNVKIQCGWWKVSSNGWVAVPSPQISNHECAATPDTLRSMRYDTTNGRMTPNC